MPIPNLRHSIVALLVGCLGVSLTACGGADDGVATVTETQTIVERVAADAAESATDDAASTDRESRRDTKASSSSRSSAEDEVVVPDVEGIDHQLAQDTMQAAGLYNLTEEDASGKGRALLWDRNWTVVSQSPRAGERVPEDTTIVLRSVKDDEYDGGE